MTLNELINELEQRDQNKTVTLGFGKGMSWRGSYYEASFEPVQQTTFGEMLKSAKALLGTQQEGYKGGEFLMHGGVDVHIACYGGIGEPITSYHL
jgi:hypothetical protein